MANKKIKADDIFDANIFVQITKAAAALKESLVQNLEVLKKISKEKAFGTGEEIKQYQKVVAETTTTVQAFTAAEKDAKTVKEEMDKKTEENIDSLKKENEILNTVNGTLTQNIKLSEKRKVQLKVLKTEQDNLNKEIKTGRISNENYANSTAAVAKKAEELKIANSKLLFTIKAQIKQGQAATDSFDAQNQRLGLLRTAYRQLTKEERNNVNVGGILLTQITALDKQTKKNSASIGNFQKNVGNYTGGIKKAAAETGLFAGVSNAAAVATSILSSAQAVTTAVIGTSTGALKLFRLALISTGLGIVIVLVGSLTAALLSSEKGINMVKKGFAAIGIVIGNLTDVFGEFGEQLISFFKGDGFDSTELNKKIKGIVSEIKEEVKSQNELSDLRAKTDADERKALVDKAARETLIARLRLDARDLENKTAEERIQALKDAIALENLILEDELKIANARAKISAGELEFSNSKKEAKDADAAAQAKVSEVETKSLLKQATLRSELNTLILKESRAKKKISEDAIKRSKAEQKIIDDANKKAAEEAEEFAKEEIEREDRNFREKTRILQGEIALEELLLEQSYEQKFKDAGDDAELQLILQAQLQKELQKIRDDAAAAEQAKKDAKDAKEQKDRESAEKAREVYEKKIADAKEKQRQEDLDLIKRNVDDIGKLQSNASERRISELEREGDRIAKNIEVQAALAAGGLENNLAESQKEAAELEVKKEELAEKEERRQKRQIFYQAVLSGLQSEEGRTEPFKAIAKAVAVSGLVQGIGGSFFEGTERVGDAANANLRGNGKDNTVVAVTQEERIIGHNDSLYVRKKLGNISNKDLVNLAVNGQGVSAIGLNDSNIVQGLENVQKEIQGIKFEMNIDPDGNVSKAEHRRGLRRVVSAAKRRPRLND